MNLLYKNTFRLQEAPFSITPDPRFLYLSNQHKEGLAHLMFGINHAGGFILLTGEVGTGKTTLCRHLLQQLGDDTDYALVLNPMVTAPELVQTICEELAIEVKSGTASGDAVKPWIDALNGYLIRAYRAGRRTLLIIDEAQNLTREVLEQVRLLTNLETDSEKLLRVILLGQPELAKVVQRTDYQQLAQRITARYHLGPLAWSEVPDYLAYRFRVAGGGKLPFSRAAVRLLARKCQGIPRKLNVLADRALVGAYAKSQDQVSYAIVRRAARETHIGTRFKWSTGLILVTAAIVLGSILLTWLFMADDPPSKARQDQDSKGDAAQVSSVPEKVSADPDSESVPQSMQSENALVAPFEADDYLDFRAALKLILELWHTPSATLPDSDLCAFVGRFGLACLEAQGRWQDVLKINRPALLAIQDYQGETNWLVAIAGDQHSLTIRAKDKVKTRQATNLYPQWSGHFLLIWQLPPSYYGLISEGDQNNTVNWLRESLKELGYNADAQNPNHFGAALAQQLRTFQRSRGLRADGIAGPRTIIAIHSAAGTSMPKLNTRLK